MFTKLIKNSLITETKNLSVVSSNNFKKDTSFYINNNANTKFTYLGNNKVKIEDTYSGEIENLKFNPDKTYSIRMYDSNTSEYYTTKVKFENYSKQIFSYLNVKSEEPTSKTVLDVNSYGGSDNYEGTNIALFLVVGNDEDKKSKVGLGYLEKGFKYETNKNFNILGNYFRVEKINYSKLDEENSNGRVIVNPVSLDVYSTEYDYSDHGSNSITKINQGDSFYIGNSNKVMISKVYTKKGKKYINLEINVLGEKRFYSFENNKVGSIDFSSASPNNLYNAVKKFDIVFDIDEKNEVSYNIVKERKNLQVDGSLVIYDPLSKTNISCIIEHLSYERNNTGEYIDIKLLPLYPPGAFDKKTEGSLLPFSTSYKKLDSKIPIKK